MSEEDRPSTDTKHKSTLQTKHPRVRFFSGHSIAEAGRSSWVGAIPILLFRLSVSAMLVSHVVFFSLSGDFSFRYYSTWSYVALTLAFLLVLVSSLVELLRSDDDDASQQHDEEAARDTTSSAVTIEPVDRGVSKLFAQLTVPIYQVAVTAAVFGAIVYWAFIHPSQDKSITYSVLSLHVIAPGVALLDMIFSLSMRFRLVYVPLFLLYNAVYATVLYVFLKVDDYYEFLDPSQQGKISFAAKAVGLSFGSVILALILCAISVAKEFSFVRRRADIVHKRKVDESDKSEPDEATLPTEDTSETSGELKGRGSKGSLKDDEDSAGGKRTDEVVVINEDVAEVVEDTEDEEKLFGTDTIEKRDRSSLPITRQTSSISGIGGKRKLYRMSSTGLARSHSGGSIEDEATSLRNSMSQFSVWEDLDMDGIHARAGEEYFKMPGVYTGGEDEVVKLAALPRTDSNKSGRISRSGSGRRLSRSSSNTSGGFMRSISSAKLSDLAGSRLVYHTAAKNLASSGQKPQSG